MASWHKKPTVLIILGTIIAATYVYGFFSIATEAPSQASNAAAVNAAFESALKQPITTPVDSVIQETIQSVPEENCHPSYSGCLNPNASDYDCRGGSGNGPYYAGRVQVIGYDEFGLDRDGDGWGCE